MLPKRIFFTGVPGSRWSGIAQLLEEALDLNISDRDPSKEYVHHSYSGHKGAYFGKGMEYELSFDPDYLDSPFKDPTGTRLVKSHDWSLQLTELKKTFPDEWIILVYRPDMVSYAWWHEAGGFSIKYPDYSSYIDSTIMLASIMEQNKAILKFAREHGAIWYHFGAKFMKDVFDVNINEVSESYTDCLITVIK